MELLNAMILLLSLCIFSVFYLFQGKKYSGQPLPPGSLGLPFVGESLGYLKALKADNTKGWFQERIGKNGHIWKSHLFGLPTIVLLGPSANKFVFTCDVDLLANSQPPPMTRILGPNNINELSSHDHKQIRAAFMMCLKLETLKQHVAKVDEEVQHHLRMQWHGKHELQAQPLLKTLTFNVICSLLFGIGRGPTRDKFLPLFEDMTKAVLAIPVNFPFTPFNRGVIARKKLVPMLLDLIRERKEELGEQAQRADTDHKVDLITSLLRMPDDGSSTTMSDDMIIDNVIVGILAGYDTTATLLSFLVHFLANNISIYTNIVQEQNEIAKSKALGETLTWEDITKMKYTHRVASEMLRIQPPVSVNFRQAKQDIEYGGFIIPKGWQVMLSGYMTHMDDSIYQNPTIFDPTRPAAPPYSYIPFGAGARKCPGLELAKMETLVMIHRLVTQFTWELVDKDESVENIPFPEFEQGLLLRIKPI